MIEKYIWRTILPYFLLAWVILTVILFLQQGSRFTEILFGAQIPARLLLELGGALLLTVAAFTGPMALLTGIVVGLGQMRGDSEITAMQAAGVSGRRIVLPCLLLGLITSATAFLINLAGVPFAASVIRRVAVEAALIKLESPIEPGVFNTQFNNYVIYVRAGNNERGVWERVFIYLPEKNGETVKLITARSGRIDAAQDKSELVLSDAVVTTLSNSAANKETAVDNFAAFRVSLDTGRRQLQQKLIGVERVPDEMGLAELSTYAAQKGGKEGRDAAVLWHRRLALSFAPFFLALLGAALSLRFGRGGRGWGILLSLTALVLYYLLSLLGEQTVRAGLLPPLAGGWAATLFVFGLGVWWLWKADRRSGRRFNALNFRFNRKSKNKIVNSNGDTGDYLWNKFEIGFGGLLERDLLQNILWYFLLICGALLLLFQVFTVFEVLRSLTATENGVSLLVRYLLFLSPTVLWQVAPTALMIAVLITYTLKARSRETVVWGAAGQSIYVLMFPCLILAAIVGWASWEWQERLLPLTNPRQDVLRARLRGAGSVGSQEGRFWVSADNGIYSFTAKRGSDNALASDVSFYQFNSENTHLEKIVRASEGFWNVAGVVFAGRGREVIWQKSFVEIRDAENLALTASNSENPFTQIVAKTIDMDSERVRSLIENTDSAAEARRLEVALNRKYTVLLLPFVMVFFSVPFALSTRKWGGAGKALGIALALWLVFTAATAVFERLGTEGILPPVVAVWSPLILFSSLGWYLLAKMRH